MRQATVPLSASKGPQQVAPQPHPSGCAAGEQKSVQRLSAEEFWARLGL